MCSYTVWLPASEQGNTFIVYAAYPMYSVLVYELFLLTVNLFYECEVGVE
jgi:hypothetical protein